MAKYFSSLKEWKPVRDLIRAGIVQPENWIWHFGLLRQWHLFTSQTDGFNWAASTIAATWTTYFLKKRFKLGLWKSYFYSTIPIAVLVGLFKLIKVTRIYFIQPRLRDVPHDRVLEPAAKLASPARLTLDDDELFVHQPLPQTSFSRLLLLKPALRRSSPLEAELIDWPYNVGIYYFAVSYVWGDPTLTDSISIGQKRLPITSSCFTVLKKLRHRLKARVVWIDAICINQQDLKEKEQQVQRMKVIYSHAVQTIIWLGESSARTDTAFGYLRLYGLTLQLPKRFQSRVQKMIVSKMDSRLYLLFLRLPY